MRPFFVTLLAADLMELAALGHTIYLTDADLINMHLAKINFHLIHINVHSIKINNC